MKIINYKNKNSLKKNLLNLPIEIIKKIIEYIYYSDNKNDIKITCKRTYQIYKEIHNNNIYNKTNYYIKEIFEYLLDFQDSLYIDFLREEIVIWYDDSDKPRIYFISYNNNRKVICLSYRPDWDYDRFAVSSKEYNFYGKLINNEKQKEEGFSCIFYEDWVYKQIEFMICYLKHYCCYNKSITVYDKNKYNYIINSTNNIKELQQLKKYTRNKSIYDNIYYKDSLVIKICFDEIINEYKKIYYTDEGYYRNDN